MDELEFKELMNILQNSGENERIEAKKTEKRAGKSLLETISAFSNEPGLGGGYCILGLEKNRENHSPHYTVLGISDPDKIQSEIAVLCRQNFSVQIRPNFRVITHAGKNIVLIYIPEVEPHEKPVYIKSKGLEKGAFRRIGPTDQLCTQEDLEYLFQRRSQKKYDETILENTSFEDIDPDALKSYRHMREGVNKNAEELKYPDEDLLQSLSVLIPSKGMKSLNVAGLVLFGKSSSLRRVFPIAARVDYIMIEGRDWVPDPDHRYHSIEIREGLLTGIPRLLQQIMTDIPQAFALDSEEIFRKDNPIIPRKAIREAVCNALMHRDYTFSSPVQIRRYSNRIEFENAGYSLKPEEELGLPGSITRNDTIATILHEVNLAETKGTGIRAMRDSMQEANLTIPLIESDRTSNQFRLTFLTHHLFDKRDIEWLGKFKECNLSDEEARALIIIREMGAITNADFRTINTVDTLSASNSLRKLRDLGLLEQKGRGSSTYYIPTKKMLAPSKAPDISEGTRHISEGTRHISEGTRYISEGTRYISQEEIIDIPSNLEEKLNRLTKRSSPKELQDIIKDLCSLRYLKPSELGLLLKRNPLHLRNRYLAPMVDSGELEMQFPDQPAHPNQAYRKKV